MGKLSPIPGVVEWLSGADAEGRLPHAPSRDIEIYCIDRRLVRWLWSKAVYKITDAGRRAALSPTPHEDGGTDA
jgi:hypothetical protein